jgi:hypothetical protein
VAPDDGLTRPDDQTARAPRPGVYAHSADAPASVVDGRGRGVPVRGVARLVHSVGAASAEAPAHPR